jgi:hypothetical protein
MPPHRNGEGNVGHTLPISNRSALRDLFIASWTCQEIDRRDACLAMPDKDA